MKKKPNYNHTIYACFAGYVTQSIVNNYVPLLFLTFQKEYHIALTSITLLVTLNFVVQLMTDILASKLVDRIGYRASAVAAHVFAAAGLIGLGVLPEVLPPLAGIVIAVCFYAVGGGMIEVLISPIVEACPTKRKSAVMSMLHSFYCWGSVAVIVISTAFFALFGVEHWRILAAIWAIVPIVNGLCFMRVPIRTLVEKGEETGIGGLFGMPMFRAFLVMIFCAGAGELGMSQWASAFAEEGLGVGKAVGDLAGPCMFAVLMGLTRVFYSKFSEKIDLRKFMLGSTILCALSYLLAALSGSPVFSLLGCALCGLAVGIMWPGTYSLAAGACKRGGTAMFAMFALFGDLGCMTGPTLVGFMADRFGGDLKKGMLGAMIFPVVMLFAVASLVRAHRKSTAGETETPADGCGQ